MVNSAWLVTQPAVSPLAKIAKVQATVAATCANHIIDGTEASFKACNADTANKCYAKNSDISANPVWKCATAFDASIPSLCPGSFYKEFKECRALSEEACPKDPRCISDINVIQGIWESPQMGTNTTQDLLASFGQVYKYGYCNSKKVPFTKEMIDFNDTAITTYIDFIDKWVGPSTKEDILASFGSCPYAKQSAAYIPYATKCNGGGASQGMFLFNDDWYNSTNNGVDANVTTQNVNTTALIDCLERGCSVRVIPLKENLYYTNGDQNYPIVLCAADQETIAKLKYPLHVYDSSLIRAYGLCARAEIQWNKTSCETATL